MILLSLRDGGVVGCSTSRRCPVRRFPPLPVGRQHLRPGHQGVPHQRRRSARLHQLAALPTPATAGLPEPVRSRSDGADHRPPVRRLTHVGHGRRRHTHKYGGVRAGQTCGVDIDQSWASPGDKSAGRSGHVRPRSMASDGPRRTRPSRRAGRAAAPVATVPCAWIRSCAPRPVRRRQRHAPIEAEQRFPKPLFLILGQAVDLRLCDSAGGSRSQMAADCSVVPRSVCVAFAIPIVEVPRAIRTAPLAYDVRMSWTA